MELGAQISDSRLGERASGTVNGTAINATFGGLAYPTVYNSQTSQVLQMPLYGAMSDDVHFKIQEVGIRTPLMAACNLGSQRLTAISEQQLKIG